MTREEILSRERRDWREILYAQVIGSDSKLGRIKAATELMRELDEALKLLQETQWGASR